MIYVYYIPYSPVANFGGQSLCLQKRKSYAIFWRIRWPLIFQDSLYVLFLKCYIFLQKIKSLAILLKNSLLLIEILMWTWIGIYMIWFFYRKGKVWQFCWRRSWSFGVFGQIIKTSKVNSQKFGPNWRRRWWFQSHCQRKRSKKGRETKRSS